MESVWEVEASDSSGSSEIPPEGNHAGVLVALIDLGTHEETFQGQTSSLRKAILCWELPGERKDDGSSFVVLQRYNLAPKIGGKSKLRQMLEQWRGRPMGEAEKLNLKSLLGKPCLINIGHGKSAKGNVYAKILGVSPMVKGMSAPQASHEPFEWELDSGPLYIPEWVPWAYGESIEEIIARCKERGGTGRREGSSPVTSGATANGAVLEDDQIPF